MSAPVLSNRYAEVLAFEAAGWWRYPSIKESIIRERFDVSLTRYLQILHFALRLPEADWFDPRTVRRLIERRDRIASVRRTGFEI